MATSREERRRAILVRAAFSGVLFVLFAMFYGFGDLSEAIEDVWYHALTAIDYTKFPQYGFSRFEEFKNILGMEKTLTYPVWHILFALLFSFYQFAAGFVPGLQLDVNKYIRLAEGTENAFFLVLSFNLLLNLLLDDFKLTKKKAYFFSATLMFVGPLYFGARDYLYGQFSGNPWHNPTILAVRPMAILCFQLFYRLYDSRQELSRSAREKLFDRRENIRFLILSACLLFSAFCKPNFYQVFVPGLFLFCVVDVLRTRFKSFIFCAKTGLAVIPVCLTILPQYVVSFGAPDAADSNSIVFAPLQVWRLYSDHILLSFAVSLAFPLAVWLLLCRPGRESGRSSLRAMWLSSVVFFSALIQYVLLSFEHHYASADFEWGVYLATLLVFAAAVFCLDNYAREQGIDWKCKTAFALYGLHTVCGIGYFISLAMMAR